MTLEPEAARTLALAGGEMDEALHLRVERRRLRKERKEQFVVGESA